MFLFYFTSWQSRFDSVFSVAGVLLEADWLDSLEKVGNESENLPGVNVCSCSTAGVVEEMKKLNFFWINKF